MSLREFIKIIVRTINLLQQIQIDFPDETTLGAWKMVVKKRNIEEGLIFHSDRGVQYPVVSYIQ